MIRLNFLVIIFSCFLAHPLKAQFSQGTDFWVGFMEHVDPDKNTKVLMITSGSRTSGTVEVPMKGWKKDFTVSPDEVAFVKLPMSVETIGSEWRQETGVRVRSRQPVSVYAHQYANSRSEAALVLPVASLDDEYYVMSYKGYEEQGVAYPSEFLIVAVAHDTELEIIPKDFTKKGRPPGSLNRITLNRGETFQVQGQSPRADLTGSYIKANKPFALFAGNVWTQVPGECIAPDNLYEQMYPISSWGTETIA
ncbi:IgGFc-binding protein, partial [bacterium]|nr:IgGFc-binding protein [bacterium]